MTLTEGRGVRFALYATTGELSAIKAVDLFYTLAEIVAQEAKLDTLVLPTWPMHEHFPSFALKLGLPAHPDFFRATEGRKCLAIALHDRVYCEQSGITVAGTILYLHHVNVEKKKEGAMAIARSAGVRFIELQITLPRLLTWTKETLDKMGVALTPEKIGD